MNNIFPIKKTLTIMGIKVQLIKFQDKPVGAKVFSGRDDELGLRIYRYLHKEGMMQDSFLIT